MLPSSYSLLLYVAAAVADLRAGAQTTSLLNTWLPSLRTPELLGPPLRRLQPANHDGTWPSEHHSHKFVGLTDGGFLDLTYDAHLRGTVVRFADYGSLLAGASFTCGGEQPLDATWTLELTVPVPAMLANADESAHFAQRMQSGALLSFDPLLLTSPSFAQGSACGARVDLASSPFFEVQTASSQSSPSEVRHSLLLKPVEWHQAFHSLDFEVDFNPNATEALAERRLAGKPLGDLAKVAAFERRQLGSIEKPVVGEYLNSVSNNPLAAIQDLVLFSSAPNALKCTNCFASFTVGVRASLSMCASSKPTVFDATTKSLDGVCSALNTETTFDMSLAFQASVYGSAGYNFALSSQGINAQATTGSCPQGTSVVDADGLLKSNCLINPPLVPWTNPTSITLTIGGVPVLIELSFKLDMAASAFASMPGRFSFGSGASASVTLGGGASFPNLATLQRSGPTLTSFKTFTPSYTSVPFSLSGFTSFTGAAELVVAPTVKVTLYGVLPVQSAVQIRLQAAVGSSSVPGGLSASSLSADAPSCTSSQGPYVIGASVGLDANIAALTIRAVASSVLGNTAAALVPATQLWALQPLFGTMIS
jgi:hypothetical protein